MARTHPNLKRQRGWMPLRDASSLTLRLGMGVLASVAAMVGSTADAAAPAIPAKVSYHRHVAPLLSRLNCNGGTCHGAVQGQNGFRLSLFGAAPADDALELTKGEAGRRLDLFRPENSLFLAKGSARLPHAGGRRMERGSAEYAILKRWIEAGTPIDQDVPLTRLEVTPDVQTVAPGKTYLLKVTAVFGDGTREDVTGLCSYETRDKQVAQVSPAGQVTATGVGDTALIVRYRTDPAVVLAIVPRPGTEPFPAVKPRGFIDEEVLAKLRRLNVPPSGEADDPTFLRRARLDVTGSLPTPDEVRAFVADRSPDKRSRKIDELLADPGHAALWAMKFCDLLKASDYGVYADAIREEVEAPRMYEWLRARLTENVPYDELVERILTATSREGQELEPFSEKLLAMQGDFKPGRPDIAAYTTRRTLDIYWQRKASAGVPGALQVAHSFLGLRLDCAQCHRHPHDVWRQDDLLSFANFVTRVSQSGFSDQSEKKRPEVAAIKKRWSDEAKQLEEEGKKLKEGDAKRLESDAKTAKSEADKLNGEIRKLEGEKKALADKKAVEKNAEKQAEHDAKLAEIETKLTELRSKLEPLAAAQTAHEAMRQKLNDMDKKSKLLSEAGTKLLHAEIRHMSESTAVASVTSPLGTQKSEVFRLLGEDKAVTVAAEQDPRVLLAAWMRKADNPFFARAIVNRAWAHYFGRGIVDPPDHLSPLNPASHPKLLEKLAAEFVAHKYDLKWLHRTIVASRTYQQSSDATAANAMDRTNYAYFYYRRLPAEVLVDSLNQATGTSEDFGMKGRHWPEKLRTIEIPFQPQNAFVNFVLEQFGRPARNSAVQCDCQRDGQASVLQVLSLANHPRVWGKVSDPKGLATRVAKELSEADARIDELYLTVLSRWPDAKERQACRDFLAQAGTVEQGVQGVLWSLINTREFLLQH